MNDRALEKSSLFRGLSAEEIRVSLKETPHRILRFEKGEILFHLLDPASRIGLILEGRVEAQKAFPNGREINVSVRMPGEIIGAAAAFSENGRYPCDIVALEPVSVLLFRKEDLLALMQRNGRILANLTAEIASAACMLQLRLELFSYSGIAQKAAFWLLIRSRQTGKDRIRIPGSVTKWAALMNVSRPSLHRELRRLAEEGMIAYSPPFVTILDADALREILSRQTGH